MHTVVCVYAQAAHTSMPIANLCSSKYDYPPQNLYDKVFKIKPKLINKKEVR